MPVRKTVCANVAVPFDSFKVRVALVGPPAVGFRSKETVQLPLAGRVLPQVAPLTEKSLTFVPESQIPENVRGEALGLVRVTV